MYPNGESDGLAVTQCDVLLEIAGVDGGLLVVVEAAVYEFEGHGCFADSACVSL